MATPIRFATIVALLQIVFFSTAQAGTIGHGHLHYSSSLQKRDLAISPNLPGQWTSKGCYTDNPGKRALGGKNYAADSVTQESCINFCQTNGYQFAGTEYSRECFCSNLIGASGQPAATADCNMPCAGDKTEACGGPDRINIFHNDAITTKPAGPATNAGVSSPAGGYGFLGCYTDNVGARTLTVGMGTVGGAGELTVAKCGAACGAANYKYFGVEYSQECYCGNSFSNGGGPAPDGLTGCNMVCNGNSSEFCGGPDRLNVYGLGQRSTIAPKWANLGCYTDVVGKRTLSVGMATLGGGANMTVENCQNACFANNYNIAGVEYAQECYCDNDFRNGGGPAPDKDAGCNMNCNGDSYEICGGPDRLNIYRYDAGASTTTTTTTVPVVSTTTTTTTTTTTPSTTITTTTTTTTTSSTTSSTTTTTTTITTTTTSATTSTTAAPTSDVYGLPSGWTYRGCYIDNNAGRILAPNGVSDTTTIESCAQSCIELGKSVAGVEYSKECFCGNSIVNGGKLANADNECGMACAGNSTQKCGGPSRMSIYAVGNLTISRVPTVQKTGLPPNWSYQGCLKDTVQRVLPYQIDMTTNLTAPNCLSLCGKFGYTAAGLQYGQQCFCGDDTQRISSGAQYADNEASCSFGCAGDPESLCGGGLLMTYYTQPPVDIFTTGTGNAAGQYKFLIGGTVIPLITSANKNGKVTFVEKHGTGAGNSTGAFELDTSVIETYGSAWREMQGLQTDVFCSAGLTLPDKGARIINVGGWSMDSTFGVRFYTPDGLPGVHGKNGWQENVDEVKLQTGRWYPSAMMMANGSILVIGGESGSNAPAVPNLEILPRPAGGNLVFMEWLNRTDPNNLYPFMAVLPSGGILACYYNEARILDERTFETVRTLPNIPGSVMSFEAGRTYPLEGTSMLLPQSYPYTDPLGVLICGGSTPYAGDALDNCVTIQPELPGQNWTIERMPSKRVMSSMVALPDGTFLIMNGAKQGVAGFGLANDPNLTPVLYDPSKPVHQRMTILSSTIVARMYHNEAMLMQDGRVLISGSDPQNLDGKYPQEYRVEVFIPPYLMALDEPLSINVSAQVQYIAGQDMLPTATNVSLAATNATASNSTGAPFSKRQAAPACGARPLFNLNANQTDWQFGQSYTFTMYCGTAAKVSLMGAVSSTHGNSMGQRTLFPQFSCSGSTCTVQAPPNAHVTGGPNWFMMFVMGSNGVPSIAEWVRIGGDPAGLGNWPQGEDFQPLPGS